MRNQERIAAEIEILKSVEQRVRPKTFFGDSNVDAVAAQIRVLQEDLDEDDIYDFFDDDDYLFGAAMDAYRWAHEDEDEAPSTDWEPLCKEEKK